MPDRRRRPAVESLEGRALLAAPTSPTNPIHVHPEPITHPTNKQLGAAYRQIVSIQVSTFQGISAAHRRLYHADDQLVARANPAIPRDRRILEQAAGIRDRAENGLVVARGVEQLDAYTDKFYVTQGLYTTLTDFVQTAQTTGSNLVRSAERGTDTAIRQIDALADHLA